MTAKVPTASWMNAGMRTCSYRRDNSRDRSLTGAARLAGLVEVTGLTKSTARPLYATNLSLEAGHRRPHGLTARKPRCSDHSPESSPNYQEP